MLSDQDNPVVDAKMVNQPSRNRVVGRRGSQRTCGQFAAPDDQPGANLIVTRVPSGPQVTLI